MANYIYRRYYIRTICRNGTHRLWGDWRFSEDAQRALTRATKKRPTVQRFVDSYMVEFPEKRSVEHG